MTGNHPRRYTSNVLKGSALIQDSLRLIQEWREDDDAHSFADRVLADNVLGKTTRSRIRDILDKVFARRFLAPGVPPIGAAKALLEHTTNDDVARKVLLFHAALADDLLYDFITQELFALHEAGSYRVDIARTLAFINRLCDEGLISPPWAPYSRLRAAQGILATVRDFGLLQGKLHKSFAPAFLHFDVFIYVAAHLNARGVTAFRLREHTDWRLFLMTTSEIERLLLEAHQLGFLHYHAAGGIVRIDWLYSTRESVIDGLIARAPIGA